MYGQDAKHGREQLEGQAFSSGTFGWTYKTKGWVYAAPCVDGNETVYVSSWGGDIYAINPDGSLQWRFVVREGEKLWSSPALGTWKNISTGVDSTVIYVGGDKSLLALRVGAWGEAEIMWEVHTALPIFASPTVSAGNIFIGGLDGSFRAVRSVDGVVLWKYNCKGFAQIYASAVVSSTAVYFPTMEGEMIALDKQTGQVLWTSAPSSKATTSSPSISKDGRVVYAASQDGQLRAFNTTNGGVVWSFEVGFVDGSSTAISADGTIFIGSLDSHLYAVDPNGALVWKFKADSQIQSAPGSHTRDFFCKAIVPMNNIRCKTNLIMTAPQTPPHEHHSVNSSHWCGWTALL
jgi:outer membrane protein assembly factor BamB